jgi:hypothetical protein
MTTHELERADTRDLALELAQAADPLGNLLVSAYQSGELDTLDPDTARTLFYVATHQIIDQRDKARP